MTEDGTTQESSEETPQEQPEVQETEDVAAAPEDEGPKGEPSDEQRDRRVERERDEARLQAEYWQRQAQLKPQQQVANPQTSEPPEEKLFGKDDEDFVNVRQMKQLVNQVIKPLAQRQVSSEQKRQADTVQQIDQDGQERWDDYMEVASFAGQAMNTDSALKHTILNAPDPAAMAYSYGSQVMGRRNQDAAATKAQKIVRNSKQSKTLAGVQGSTNGGKMGIDKLMSLSFDEYRKRPADERNRAFKEARDAGRL